MAVRKIFIRFCNNIFCNEINEINKRGGWNFSKSVSVGPTFIREMRVSLLNLWWAIKTCSLHEILTRVVITENPFQRPC